MKRFWEAARPYSFTAALVPVVIGFAATRSFPVGWFLVTLLGAIAAQTVANVVNDLYDARTGLDRPDNAGAMNALVRGLITEREAKAIVLVASVVGLGCAALAVARVGTPIVPWLIGGGLVAFFYTAPPIALKRRALGDLAVAFGFGIGYAAGAALIASGGEPSPEVRTRVWIWAVPAILLVVAILHANNHRDREADRANGARTLANSLSLANSRTVLLALVGGAYVWTLGLVLIGNPWAVLPLFTLPLAIPLLRKAARDDVGGMFVPEIAKLHGAFGLLLATGLAFTAL